jgi:ABC-type multidrug transport system ATPase subunit
MLGGLKGIQASTKIDELKSLLDLDRFSDLESQFLSGGNKRKLLIAIAFI